MNAKDLFDLLVRSITISESKDEIKSIVLLVLEKMCGLSQTDILAQKDLVFEFSEELGEIVNRINSYEPVQYVLGESYFLGRRFFVNEHVLIPRAETEQLVMLVTEEYRNKENVCLLDIGTGSGCIAVSLSKELPHSTVFAIDISKDALEVAKNNAELNKVLVQFENEDILSDSIALGQFSCLVSNPPYITHSEKKSMRENVLNYEPHLALFVTDDDPIVFYRAIARQGRKLLEKNGKIFVEINEALAESVCAVFREYGFFKTQTIKDIAGKDRFVIASLTP